MRNKKIILVGVLIVLVVIVLITAKNNNQTNTSYNIGAVIPLTGTAAYWGEPVQRGILLAQETIDKKFGNGTLKILIEDGKSDPKESVSAAQKLLSINKADAIYVELSGPSSSVAPVVKNAEKIYYYGAFNDKVVSNFDNAIKGFLSYTGPCEFFGKYLKSSGISKVAILNQFPDTAPSCAVAPEKYIPHENILLLENLPKDNDFRSILLQIKSFGAGAIIGMTYEGPSLAWIKQMKDLGMNLPVLSGHDDALTQNIIDTIGINNLEGSLYFDARVNPDFVNFYKEKYPDSPSSDLIPAGYAYEGIVNLAEAIISCKSNVSCTVKSFNNRTSDAGAIIGAGFKNRVLTSSLDYYLIKSGTTTLFNF